MVSYPKNKSLKECIGYVIQQMDERGEDFDFLVSMFHKLCTVRRTVRFFQHELKRINKILDPHMCALINRGLYPPKKNVFLKKEGNVIYLYENKDEKQ